jgi:hypothetical protein
VIKLDHHSVRILELDKVKDSFYDLLNLIPRFIPNYNLPGYWLYNSYPKQAIVHLIGQKSGHPPLDIGEETGAYDHMAFQADNYHGISERIKANDWKHWENSLPNGLSRQIFVKGSHNLSDEIVLPAQ